MFTGLPVGITRPSGSAGLSVIDLPKSFQCFFSYCTQSCAVIWLWPKKIFVIKCSKYFNRWFSFNVTCKKASVNWCNVSSQPQHGGIGRHVSFAKFRSVVVYVKRNTSDERTVRTIGGVRVKLYKLWDEFGVTKSFNNHRHSVNFAKC